jgi:small subunit ribosomal protein S21
LPKAGEKSPVHQWGGFDETVDLDRPEWILATWANVARATGRICRGGQLCVPWKRRLIPVAEVQIQDGETLENALRRFKRKVVQEDIIKEIKRHSFYLKPGEKKRVKSVLARKRDRKKRARDTAFDKPT